MDTGVEMINNNNYSSSSSTPSMSEELKDVTKGVIKLLVSLVFLGTVIIWIMLPTNTYSDIWKPKIQALSSKSSYFGSQGAPLLTFMFPMLLIASMGCVYIHLKQQKNYNPIERGVEQKMGVSSKWKRPMLVKGPLGIVSGTELGFLIMFMALLVWSLYSYLSTGLASITPQSAAVWGENLMEAKLDTIAATLGWVGNICLALLFYPVARGSSVLPLMGLTSESTIKYHIWLGHLVMILFTAHGLLYVLIWGMKNNISEVLGWARCDISNLAGEISLAAGLILWVTTFGRIRRKSFELFFYAHHLYIVFVVFFLFHVGISYSLKFFPGFYLFILDRYLRFLQSRDNVRLVSARVLPCDTLELTFSKNPRLTYTPTSILFLNIPSISKLQWHPFTITSSSNLEPEKLSVMIKSEGSWSTKLYNMLSSSSPVNRLEASIEGPYGPASTDFLRYDALVMISGGSGITPFISIIRDLIAITGKYKCPVPRITLVCAFKNSSDLTMLDLILPVTGSQFEDISKLDLQIEAFVTREKEPENNHSKNIRSIWFKPHVTDSPISPILGPNGYLWLGAIISSSFLIFMVLIGLITHYYIYPIDHNTNKIYSYSSRAILNILVICVSIGVIASAAVFWNKKKYAREGKKQIQSVEMQTPEASPSSWFYNADRELESLPQQSLVQATNLHYGQRPDLKKILFGSKGSRVGVLVCGPKKMRHEAAMICSSGLADNLHFESISFSW